MPCIDGYSPGRNEGNGAVSRGLGKKEGKSGNH